MGIEMEGANRKANLTDTEGNIKKEPFVLETDVNVMQKTVLLENEIAVKKEPELSDKMKSESSPVETGRTMKIEPGTGPFEDSSSADHLRDNMSIKFEPAEKELFKQKLVIKWKHKPSKKSRSLSLKGRNLQDKHKPNGMPDTLSDNGNFMRIKCEPMADENAYLTREPEHFTVSEIEVNQHCLSPEMITKQKRISHLCSHCQQHFCSRSSLKRHYKRKHSSEGLSFSCKECDAVFTRLIQFRAHERKHRGGDKTFPCQECDVIFTRACHLKVHMRKHTDERPFTCEDCGATFRSTSNLNRHKMKHSGLRPYICTVCNANFYQSSHLVSHVRKHTGERPFTCVECSATFSQLTHLHRHKAKHTGRKPYLCCECGSGFVENCALKRHMLIHNKRMEANHARKRQRRVVGKVANRNLT